MPLFIKLKITNLKMGRKFEMENLDLPFYYLTIIGSPSCASIQIGNKLI